MHRIEPEPTRDPSRRYPTRRPERTGGGAAAGVLGLQRLAGNRAVRRMLSSGGSPRVAAADGEEEIEAARAADRALRAWPPTAAAGDPRSLIGRDGAVGNGPTRRLGAGPDTDRLAAARFTGPAGLSLAGASPASGGRLPGGRPLPRAVRSDLEPRFGRDLQDVRVHTGDAAADAARELRARAFALGADIVFGAGEYAPGMRSGRGLLAHELTHVLQWSSGEVAEGTILRQPQETAEPASPAERPIFIPGTGLTLIPGPARPASLLGWRLPVPASVRLTNALGAGGGPTFVLDASPQLLVLNLLDNIELTSTTRSGTPPGAEGRPENRAGIRLLGPRLTFQPDSRRLRGSAVLSFESDYPTALIGPTDVGVEIESTEVGAFTGRLGYGPLSADFSLRLHYDTDRLERALSPVLSPSGGFAGLWSDFLAILRAAAPGLQPEASPAGLREALQGLATGQLSAARFVARTMQLVHGSIPAGADADALRAALTQFAREATHPGFSLRGTVGLGIPFLGRLPLTAFSAEAPTTVPLERPLLGAPAPFPLTYAAGGVIIAPPGSLSETAVPALGATYSSYGARSGTSVTGALLPTMSPEAVSAGEPFVRQFPVFAYVEVSHVRRVSDELDLGLRLIVQGSTPELAGGPRDQPGDAGATIDRARQQFQEAQSGAPSTIVPNVGLTVFGRFR